MSSSQVGRMERGVGCVMTLKSSEKAIRLYHIIILSNGMVVETREGDMTYKWVCKKEKAS